MIITSIKEINLEKEKEALKDFSFEYICTNKTEIKAKKLLYEYRDRLIKDIDNLENEFTDKITLDMLNLLTAMIIILCVIQNDTNNFEAGIQSWVIGDIRAKILKEGIVL